MFENPNKHKIQYKDLSKINFFLITNTSELFLYTKKHPTHQQSTCKHTWSSRDQEEKYYHSQKHVQ